MLKDEPVCGWIIGNEYYRRISNPVAITKINFPLQAAGVVECAVTRQTRRRMICQLYGRGRFGYRRFS